MNSGMSAKLMRITVMGNVTSYSDNYLEYGSSVCGAEADAVVGDFVLYSCKSRLVI